MKFYTGDDQLKLEEELSNFLTSGKKEFISSDTKELVIMYEHNMDGHLKKRTQIYFIPERKLIKVSKDAEEVFYSSSLSKVYQTIVKKLSKIYFNEEYWSPLKKSL